MEMFKLLTLASAEVSIGGAAMEASPVYTCWTCGLMSKQTFSLICSAGSGATCDDPELLSVSLLASFSPSGC